MKRKYCPAIHEEEEIIKTEKKIRIIKQKSATEIIESSN